MRPLFFKMSLKEVSAYMYGKYDGLRIYFKNVFFYIILVN